MKSYLLTLCFLLAGIGIQAQSDKLVKILVHNDNIEFLNENCKILKETVDNVQIAFAKQDNDAIGKLKRDVIHIIHKAPSILSSMVKMARLTQEDPNAAGARTGSTFEEMSADLLGTGNYQLVELLPEEINALSVISTKCTQIKKELKAVDYAIHESQKSKNSEQNVEKAASVAFALFEAAEIVKIGTLR